LLAIATVSVASAQEDPLQHANHELKQATNDKVFCTFEERTRWEQKFGVNFGKSVDQQDMLSRLRVGCGVAPASWLTVYAMGQDARVPVSARPLGGPCWITESRALSAPRNGAMFLEPTMRAGCIIAFPRPDLRC
jgi:hypothetical protein